MKSTESRAPVHPVAGVPPSSLRSAERTASAAPPARPRRSSRCAAIRRTAVQLVEDEVQELVDEPWSRKGACPLRRGGATSMQVFLDGELLPLRRTRVCDQRTRSE